MTAVVTLVSESSSRQALLNTAPPAPHQAPHTCAGGVPQIQGENQAALVARNIQYRGVLGTIQTMVRTEGPRSLYNGLVAGLQRQMSFASVRIGLYDSVKQFYTKGSERKCGAGPRLLGLFFSVMIAASTFCCVAPLGLKIPRRIRGRENWQGPDSPNDNRALGLCQL